MGYGRDPGVLSRFKVEIEGIEVGTFREVEGIENETEIVEYQDGEHDSVRKRPGKTSFSNIVLRRGWTDSTELIEWREAVMRGEDDVRKSGSVVMYNDRMERVMAWNFFEGWPSKYVAPTLVGKVSDIAVEEIHLCVEKVVRVS